MGFSSESYTFMTMCRQHIKNYYSFREFQVFAHPLRAKAWQSSDIDLRATEHRAVEN